MTAESKDAITAALTNHINDEDDDGGSVIVTKYVICAEFVTPTGGPWLATVASTDLTKWEASGMASYLSAKANSYAEDD